METENNFGSITEQLGIKIKCLSCTGYVEKHKTLKGYNCYACGNCYNPLTGLADPHLTKHFIYQEFKAVGIELGPKSIDMVYVHCKTSKVTFGGALNFVLKAKMKEMGKSGWEIKE